MPKVIINKPDLPGVSKDGFYTMRFRIVSDDKNNVSYWTPIYNVFVPDENGKYVKDALTVNVYHDPIGQAVPQNYNVYVSWHDPNNLGFYDIYTKWHSNNGWTDWIYHTTTASRNYVFNPPMYLVTNDPDTYFDRYSVSVTRSTFEKVYSDRMALFSTSSMPGGGISLV